MAFLTTLVAAIVAGASAHMCTLDPLQRGGAATAGNPADNICFQTTGPCGTVAAGSPSAAYLAGSKVTVTMMKNLDHYYATTPGNFTVALWDSKGNSAVLGSYPDTPAPSLSLYPLNVIIPANTANGSYVIQAAYYPGNPAAPPAFYQCSDVMVLTPAPGAEEAAAAAHAHMHHGAAASLRGNHA